MEETLLDNIEIDTSEPFNDASSRTRSYNSTATPGEQNILPRRYELKVHNETSLTRSASSGAVSNAIMMYSPYIPSSELRNVVDLDTDIGNYYSRIETEETVKCLVTSFLFCAVVVCIFLVAILKNPGM